MRVDSLLPTRWTTERLSITDTIRGDIYNLERISNALSYMSAWAGPPQEHPSEHLALDSFEGGNLPPDGDKALAKMQTIQTTQDDQIIGYLEAYHGFPTEDIFWIAGFYFHPDCHKQGYGLESIAQLVVEVGRLIKYSAIRLSVDIKNWPALRFWTRNGFDKVVACHGDAVYTENTFANLILERPL